MHLAGFRIRYLPDVEIVHHGGASVKTFDRADRQVYGDRYRYFTKWFGVRGAIAIRSALWSRVAYEAIVEIAHGDLRFAAAKLKRGMRLNGALALARHS
jgi:GT2 family glycosyltransferase